MSLGWWIVSKKGEHKPGDRVLYCVLNPQVQREGVVLRPLAVFFDQDIGGRLSFKAINPKFLLKYDE